MRAKLSIIINCLILVIFTPVIYVIGQESDEIMQYYWGKAKAEFQSNALSESSGKYQVFATTHYKHVDSDGIVTKIDSASVKYLMTGNKIDTFTVITGDNKRFFDLTFTINDFFDTAYYQFPYPNDTGGIDLAIGFDSDSTVDLPDGFLIIDRNKYKLKWLYLYYTDKENYRRFSRSFRFAEFDSFIYPDSIWEVGTREGFLALENFRIETKVDSIILVN